MYMTLNTPVVRFRWKRQRLKGTLFILIFFLVALLAPHHASSQTVTSPTGSIPPVFWTPQRQTVWNQMVAQNHPWWVALQSWASGTVAKYGDIGDYAAIAYQMTGDATYAQRSYSIIQPWITSMTLPQMNLNETREDFMSYCWIYAFDRPGLTPAQRTAYIKWLNWMGDLVLNKDPNNPWGNTRLSDCDVTIGHYFGLAFLDLATGLDNPRAGTFLNSTWVEPQTTKLTNVGGLTSTGINRNTMRNAIADYVNKAKGGVSVESSDYNLCTMKLLIMGAEGVKTATGQDYFPEITAFLPQLAMAHLNQHTPDGDDTCQWGDVEWNRQLWISTRVTLTGMLAGLTQGNPSVGPYLQKLTQEQNAWPGEWGSGMQPYARFFMFYNPYAPATDWRPNIPKGYIAIGRGMQYLHDGWNSNSSLFSSHMPPLTNEDHETGYFGNYQLYRHGEWAITHPIGYYETYVQGSMGANGMMMAGLGSAREARGPIASEVDTQGNYAYQVGTTGGNYVTPNYWNPPPTYLHEWTRNILYLPSSDKLSDTIVVYDRTNVENPQNLPNFTSYYPNEQAQMSAQPSVKQWLIHTPVQPTISGNAISWTTAGGQKVRVNTLLPLATNKQALDETTLTWPQSILPNEFHWQVRVSPSTQQQWDTFLNVVQAYDNGTTLTNTLVKGTAGEAAEGVLVSRTNLNDTLALFSARNTGTVPPTPINGNVSAYNPNMINLLAAASTLEVGYTVSWTSSTAQTDLYLANLDATKNWVASVDGGASNPILVSNQGLGRTHVSGAGVHTLVLSVGTVAPTTYTIQGQVTVNGTGLANALVSAGDLAAFTDANGNYTISGLLAGSYMLNVSKKEYTFSNQPVVTVGPSRSGINVTGVQTTYTAAGRVIDNNGNGLGNANVTVGNTQVPTAKDGSFTVKGLVAGPYTLTASAPGFNFANTQTVTVGPSQAGVNFAGAPATYSISGKVTCNGNPMSNVGIKAGPAFALTASDGSYSISGLPMGNYTVTPSLAGYTFSASQQINLNANAAGINFTGNLIPPSTLANFTLASSSIKGSAWGSVNATITLSAPTSGMPITLTSSNAAICPVKSVWASGKTLTIAIPALPVKANTKVTITASAGGVSKSVVLTVTP